MSTMPTPASLFGNTKRRPIPAPPAPPALIAVVEPTDPGKVVTLGHVDEVVSTIHDGVVKAKNLRRGQRVRPYVYGEPRGSERIVESVTKIDDGALWRIEFASAHPTQNCAAAYRWFDESLVGTTVQHIVKVPGFVPAHS